ncbi:MAG: hypothetical protein AVDCRST_MAG33-3209 [uncultured Thermomicrobiales bacterium]|uniref:Uncharacterized protein n=1 Tax=uncultured Thermomicrobiales bacterium TaxID=1645740 RepID=A0A6J4VHC4_9BACT|nr:MAG: hypothetical protein AVDCRST_MAG33-3209 [uncultured Thermomicrobiales bacterium]
MGGSTSLSPGSGSLPHELESSSQMAGGSAMGSLASGPTLITHRSQVLRLGARDLATVRAVVSGEDPPV